MHFFVKSIAHICSATGCISWEQHNPCLQLTLIAKVIFNAWAYSSAGLLLHRESTTLFPPHIIVILGSHYEHESKERNLQQKCY